MTSGGHPGAVGAARPTGEPSGFVRLSVRSGRTAGFTLEPVRLDPSLSQEDAADARDAGRRLHGEAESRNRVASEGGGLGNMGGGLGDVLAGMVGGGGQGGLPGLASLLDLDRDGNPLDDILGMAGKLTRS